MPVTSELRSRRIPPVALCALCASCTPFALVVSPYRAPSAPFSPSRPVLSVPPRHAQSRPVAHRSPRHSVRPVVPLRGLSGPALHQCRRAPAAPALRSPRPVAPALRPSRAPRAPRRPMRPVRPVAPPRRCTTCLCIFSRPSLSHVRRGEETPPGAHSAVPKVLSKPFS